MRHGWDRFLTERDREHLRVTARDKSEPFGLGSRPAVLVVDNYYSVVGLEREPILESVKTWPMSCGLEGWEAIDRTVGLLRSAREAGVPVIYVTALPGFPKSWYKDVPNRLDHLTDIERRKAYEIIAEIAPEPDELVIFKRAPSSFQGTPLLFHLNALSIDTLIVCGESTSGCVRATVVDGATHRYHMGVVEECCYDRTEASHWMNLFDMDQKYADVMSLETTISYLHTPRPAMSGQL